MYLYILLFSSPNHNIQNPDLFVQQFSLSSFTYILSIGLLTQIMRFTLYKKGLYIVNNDISTPIVTQAVEHVECNFSSINSSETLRIS